MKRLLLTPFLILLSLNILFAQCFESSCIPKEIKETCTVDKSKGCIDWTNGIMYAVGLGIPNPDYKVESQKKAMALRAAKLDGMRNLLEMLEGVNISSQTTVKAGMLTDDTIESQISGKLQNVIQAGQKSMNDGSVWMTVKMYMKDIRPILLNTGSSGLNSDTWHTETDTSTQASSQQTQTESQDTKTEESNSPYGGLADQVYSGLIIDASGTGLTPALSPKIYSESGQEIYGSANVGRDFSLKYGISGYAKDLDKAKSNDRIKGNVLLLKAKGLYKGNDSDLRISNDDANLLSQLDKTQAFLREARVMILLD
jgi:hypothetical protein